MEAIINEFPKYKVYSDGRIFSTLTNVFLKLAVQPNGYNAVTLYKKDTKARRLVHRIVALHFVSNPENKPQINHVNGIKTDNRSENLEWCTGSENINHAYKTGIKTISEKHRASARAQRDGKHPHAKKAINIATGEIFDTIELAAKSIGSRAKTLSAKLTGREKNNTNIRYYLPKHEKS